VKVYETIEALLSDFPDKTHEVSIFLLPGDDDDSIQMGIALHELSVGFLDQIGNGRMGKLSLQKGYCRSGHDDVSHAAQTNEKDLI